MALSTLWLALKVIIVALVYTPLALINSTLQTVPGIIDFIWLNFLDLFVFAVNVFTPELKKGTVVKPGLPGHKGIWPKFVPPGPDDSRAPCPYLNALANHGLLPHDGKNIKLAALGKVMQESFNFSATLCKNTVNSVAGLYGRDTIDLGDLAAHNLIEHDASIVRHDAFHQPDQTKPAKDLVNALLGSATGPPSSIHPQGYVTPADLSRFMQTREEESKKSNPTFKLSASSRFFGASNATLLYEAVKGDVATCRTVLLEERFPDGFESSMRQRLGLSMHEFHLRSLQIYLTQATGIVI